MAIQLQLARRIPRQVGKAHCSVGKAREEKTPGDEGGNGDKHRPAPGGQLFRMELHLVRKHPPDSPLWGPGGLSGDCLNWRQLLPSLRLLQGEVSKDLKRVNGERRETALEADSTSRPPCHFNYPSNLHKNMTLKPPGHKALVYLSLLGPPGHLPPAPLVALHPAAQLISKPGEAEGTPPCQAKAPPLLARTQRERAGRRHGAPEPRTE